MESLRIQFRSSLRPPRESSLPSEPSVVIALYNDESRVRMAARWQSAGHSVSTASSGLEALCLLSEALLGSNFMESAPTLIILDDLLPGVLGRTVVDGIRDMGGTTPVILLSDRQRHDDAWTTICPPNSSDDLIVASATALVARHPELSKRINKRAH